MNIVRHCPTCRNKIMMHSELDTKATHPPAITITSESSAHDAPVLEALIPAVDDGCDLVGIRNDNGSVTFTRKPRAGAVAAQSNAGLTGMNRADLETLAAENSIGLDPYMNDTQLRQKLAKAIQKARA